MEPHTKCHRLAKQKSKRRKCLLHNLTMSNNEARPILLYIESVNDNLNSSSEVIELNII